MEIQPQWVVTAGKQNLVMFPPVRRLSCVAYMIIVDAVVVSVVADGRVESV